MVGDDSDTAEIVLFVIWKLILSRVIMTWNRVKTAGV